MTVPRPYAIAILATGLSLVAACAGGVHGGASSRPSTAAATVVSTTTLDVDGHQETVLTDQKGLTLYTYALDRNGTSSCTGGCIQSWPPVLVPRLSGGVRAALPLPGGLGVEVRPGGARQVTYAGHPLYTFVGDTKPGQANGQGIDGLWSVALAAAAQAPVPTPVAQPVAPSRPSASPAPVQTQSPPAFNDHDDDNGGGPSDGDGNG
jgi:predicted lipoprotein with Yx(FWY)xxD motif